MLMINCGAASAGADQHEDSRMLEIRLGQLGVRLHQQSKLEVAAWA